MGGEGAGRLEMKPYGFLEMTFGLEMLASRA